MEIIHISKKLQHRALKPCRESNNNREQVNSIKKCLFGPPDVREVEKLVQEQLREDRERIRRDFGIDLEEIENMENARVDARTPKKRKLGSVNRKNIKRKRLFQLDRKITDFYQVRKTAQGEKKDL